MSDGTAFRAAGVRLKNMRGSGLRCVITGHTDNRTTGHFFLFGPMKPQETLSFLEELVLDVMQSVTKAVGMGIAILKHSRSVRVLVL